MPSPVAGAACPGTFRIAGGKTPPTSGCISRISSQARVMTTSLSSPSTTSSTSSSSSSSLFLHGKPRWQADVQASPACTHRHRLVEQPELQLQRQLDPVEVLPRLKERAASRSDTFRHRVHPSSQTSKSPIKSSKSPERYKPANTPAEQHMRYISREHTSTTRPGTLKPIYSGNPYAHYISCNKTHCFSALASFILLRQLLCVLSVPYISFSPHPFMFRSYKMLTSMSLTLLTRVVTMNEFQ